MARYTVHMTFEAPGQRAPLRVTHRLPGRAASMQWLGGDGVLAVSASRVQAETPAEAAMIVVSAVQVRWRKHLGTLQMRSWTAHRDRVLLGGRGPASGWSGRNDSDGPDEGGSAGVREPRRPLPGPGSLHAALDLPGAGLD
jgi:hypothetical protein